ncbi:hypothetical protein TraAM80_04002 [Trypanosoma rangeli]|uniref:Uncharacterized protein n=1 Tax=Trypanosoma rangeli TaxID=5698 RepID=A0A3R7RLH8_TRYRA|nr:uncharacterized protein TraAM80_04002 [Trypanosoma rangeli]RNF06499.1 hypothetical protein TraAM80_04002 [Trypanosoma rangeli]|eukprot:RNF06499.1 hypothetical protein TraAM80_04002 [Trypanosoma rangeli]
MSLLAASAKNALTPFFEEWWNARNVAVAAKRDLTHVDKLAKRGEAIHNTLLGQHLKRRQSRSQRNSKPRPNVLHDIVNHESRCVRGPLLLKRMSSPPNFYSKLEAHRHTTAINSHGDLLQQ